MEPEETEVDDTIPVILGGALPSAEALKVYQRRSGLVENQIRNHMAALEKARDNLRAQRAGPSSAERLLSIAAALGQPTRTGSFGETLGNVGAVLSSQEKAKREAAAENAALAEKYGMQIGNEQLRLLMQGETGAREGLRASLAQEAAAERAARADKAANAPTSTVRTIEYALTLPIDDPKRKLILASVAGTPENIAAMVTKAAGIQGTKPPPKLGKPRYRRGADGTVYVSRD
jgi:hypothetical protein